VNISIGTAQLGMKYGVASNHSKMKIEDFSKILDHSKKKNIKYIDTAMTYGDSEKIIGDLLKKKKLNKTFKIITKIPNLRFVSRKKIYIHILSEIKQSIKKLGVNNLYAILIHDTKDLNSEKINIIYKSLLKIKKIGLVKKIGFSVYKSLDLKKFIKLYNFDIIQFPFNVFDQRILQKKIQYMLKSKKIELHIRSIFLQGLLLLSSKEIIQKGFKKNKSLKKWEDFLNKKNIKPLDACINFILKYNFYSKLIIGFDNYIQFKNVVKKYEYLKKNEININYNKLKTNGNLINPSKWKNK